MKLFIAVFISTWLMHNRWRPSVWKIVSTFFEGSHVIDRVLGFCYLTLIIYMLLVCVELLWSMI